MMENVWEIDKIMAKHCNYICMSHGFSIRHKMNIFIITQESFVIFLLTLFSIEYVKDIILDYNTTIARINQKFS